MPTVKVDPDELRTLATVDEISNEELVELLFSLGMEKEEFTDEELVLEFGPDRLDRLSVEGIARSLRTHTGQEMGVQNIETSTSTLKVDATDAPDGRPYTAAFVANNVNISESVLDSLIQLQEKLHATLGRDRERAAIGIHNLDSVNPRDETIEYKGVDNGTMKPLDWNFIQPLGTIQSSNHPIGKKHGHIIDRMSEHPVYVDDAGIFSYPPIINSERTRVDGTTTSLFVELTGSDQWTLDKMATILAFALSDRGAEIEQTAVVYDDEERLMTPTLHMEEMTVKHSRIEDILGIEFDVGTVLSLLGKAGLDATEERKTNATVYQVKIPPYRVDVRHPRDIIDDVGRAYGFNDIDSRYPRIGTRGGLSNQSITHRTVRDVLTGIGYQDVLTFHLISELRNYHDMLLQEDFDGLGGERPVCIEKPYSDRFEQLRTWLTPSLLTMIGENTHREYPQHISETALVGRMNENENTNVEEKYHTAVAVAGSDATYDKVRRHLEALGRALGIEVSTKPTEHPTFIDGRTATIELDGVPLGVIGEVHPQVLNNLKIDEPVAMFEINTEALGDTL
jgi:phenylalanyl-tRNA synthetase beta chain